MEIPFRRSAKPKKPKKPAFTNYTAFVRALELAITAPSEEKMEQCYEIACYYKPLLSKMQVKRAKKTAHERVFGKGSMWMSDGQDESESEEDEVKKEEKKEEEAIEKLEKLEISDIHDAQIPPWERV